MMHEVEPVTTQVHRTELALTFNLRFGIRAWYGPTLEHDAGLTSAGHNRFEDHSQYLVEGPAHCVTCCSPRTALMVQDGAVAASFLKGGVIDDGDAPPLRGPRKALQKCSVAPMAIYLPMGRTDHFTANGEMGLVMRHLDDRDNLAIAAFLKAADRSCGRCIGNLRCCRTQRDRACSRGCSGCGNGQDAARSARGRAALP